MSHREPSSDDSRFEGHLPPNNVVIDIKVITKWIESWAQSGRLWWRLFTNNQVPIWVKIIPILSLIYWLSPFDFAIIPFIGLTPLDDLAAIYFGFKLFVELCPTDLVNQIQDELTYGSTIDDQGTVIDATYQVLDDD